MAEVLELHPIAVTPRVLPRPAIRRQAEWSPTLAGTDLACLLQVIESELLPRLVSAYAPSQQSPLPTSGRG